MQQQYKVTAHWDAEAGVWCSTSNVPGLVIEAATLEEFERLVLELAPEMLAANGDVHDAKVALTLVTERHHELAVS